MTFTKPQYEFIRDVKTNILAFIGGFGSGKTLAACYKGFLLAGLNLGTAGMLVSPTYAMLRDTTRRSFLELLEEKEVGFTFKATENRIIIHEFSSEIWFRSADDPNKLKGSNLAWVGLDEPALMHKDAYLIGLSRIRDPKAKRKQMFLTGTPEGFNWLYEEMSESQDEKKRMIKSSTEDNSFLPAEYVQTLYENYDEQLVKQYIKGEFVLLNKGQVYYSFDREQNIKDEAYNQNLPLILTVDFNVSPMSWAIIQTYKDVSYVIDEISLNNSNTETAAKQFRARYPNAPTLLYGDYSGNQRHTSSLTTDYEIMQDIIKPLQVNVEPNPPVHDRVNAVNSRLCNSLGKRKLFVHSKCKEAIKDFEQVVYKEGKREIDKSDIMRTHISDAIGYYIEYEYSLKGKPQITHRFR